MSSPQAQSEFVICLRNDDYPASLEVRKIYRTLADDQAAAERMVRIIDESGEDYLYPADYFAPVQLPVEVRDHLLKAG